MGVIGGGCLSYGDCLVIMDDLTDNDACEGGAEDHWDVLENCWWQFRAMCKKSCRGRYDLIDEMMGEVVDRIERICNTWDPTYEVPLRAHVFINVRRYLWKWMNRRMKRLMVSLPEQYEGAASQDDAIAQRDSVQYILDGLDDEHREVLEMYHLQHMTFEQIAYELDVSRSTVRKLYHNALAQARRNTPRGP
jgi:RNA polymerase sigma factor (sigma-70 family)